MLIAIGTFMMIEKKEVGENRISKNRLLFYALLSAFFAALTSILGKVGIENVDSNLGTAIRTIVVLIMAWGIVFATGKQREIKTIGRKSWMFLTLSGIATGLSRFCLRMSF